MADKTNFKYFVLGESNPVRVTFNEAGLKLGAETPDPKSGHLKIDHSLLSRLEKNWDAQEIPQERFEALCQEVYQKKNNGWALRPAGRA